MKTLKGQKKGNLWEKRCEKLPFSWRFLRRRFKVPMKDERMKFRGWMKQIVAMAKIFLFLLMILKVSLKISKVPRYCISLCFTSI